MTKETESDDDIDFEAYLENRMEEVGEGHEEDEDLESLLKEAESENKLVKPNAQEQQAAQQRHEQLLKQMNTNDAEEESMDQQVTEVVSEEKVVTLELWQGKNAEAAEDEEEKKLNEKLNSLITVKPKEKKKKKVKVSAAGGSAASSVSSSAASTPSAAKQPGSLMSEVIETRISLLVSNVMNRLGKVLTVPSENELILKQNQELEKALAAKKSKEAGAQEVVDFANLESSLQRKILLLENTVTNMGELLEAQVRKDMRQRKQIKKLQKLAIDNENKYIEETNANQQLKQKMDRIVKVKNQYKKKLVQYEPSVAEQVDEDDSAGSSVLSSIWGAVTSYAASATALPKPQHQEKQATAPPTKTAPATASISPAAATIEQQQPAEQSTSTPPTSSPAKKEASSSTSAPAPAPQQTKEGTPVKKKRVAKPPQQPIPEASISEIASSTLSSWKNGAMSWFSGKQ